MYNLIVKYTVQAMDTLNIATFFPNVKSIFFLNSKYSKNVKMNKDTSNDEGKKIW